MCVVARQKQLYHSLYIWDPHQKPPVGPGGLGGFVTSNSSHRTMTISRVRAGGEHTISSRAGGRARRWPVNPPCLQRWRSACPVAGGTNRRFKSPHCPHGARYLTCLRPPHHAIPHAIAQTCSPHQPPRFEEFNHHPIPKFTFSRSEYNAHKSAQLQFQQPHKSRSPSRQANDISRHRDCARLLLRTPQDALVMSLVSVARTI